MPEGLVDEIPAGPFEGRPLAIGGSDAGVINTPGDRDSFAIELVAGESYVFTLTGSGDSALIDPYLEIHGLGPARISIDDDGGPGRNSLLRFTAPTTGTYYLHASAWDASSSRGQPTMTGAYTITAALGPPQDPLDTIDLGFSLSSPNISVYFASGGETFDGVTASRSWDAIEVAAAMAAMATFSAVTPLVFTQVLSSAGATFVLSLAELEPGVLGQFSSDGVSGFGVFDPTNDRWSAAEVQPGRPGFTTLVHEIGHGLGLAHPHDNGGIDPDSSSEIMQGVLTPFGDVGDFDLNIGYATVMSYNSITELGPGTLDIALLQQKYGANQSFNPGNDVYDLSEDVTTQGSVRVIWDTGGIDTITLGLRPDGLGYSGVIDLRAATLLSEIGGGGMLTSSSSLSGHFVIANGVVIENAIGGFHIDWLIGNDAANMLDGGGGDDRLWGYAGDDQFIGGAGFDVVHYQADPAGVQVNLLTQTATDGWGDADTLTGIEAIIGSSFGDVIFGGAGTDMIEGSDGDDLLSGGESADALHGGLGDDVVDGGAGDDFISGGPGDDQLDGGEGDDALRGEAGADVLTGGAGIDTADYSASTTGITIRLWNGTGQGGDAQGDMLSGVENVTGGSALDTLVGSEGIANVLNGAESNDYLFGLSGDDVLIGGLGIDRLDGGVGDDVLRGEAGADVLTGGAGIDTADYSASTTGITIRLWNGTGELGDAQGDTFSGVENVIGGTQADSLIGSDNTANLLNGGGGNDFLAGRSGNDEILGGIGNDTLDGGTGDDYLGGDSGNDIIVGGEGNDSLNGGGGTDTINGGNGNDLIQGVSTGSIIDGGAGVDKLVVGSTDIVGPLNFVASTYGTATGGSIGSLTVRNVEAFQISALFVQSTFTFNALRGDSIIWGNGTQTSVFVDLSGQTESLALSVNRISSGGFLGSLLMHNIGTLELRANDLDNRISAGGSTIAIARLYGGGGSDVMFGADGDDLLYGEDGNDFVRGGAGSDLLNGGAGVDELMGQSGADVLVGGAGADKLDGGDGIDTADYSAATAGVVVRLWNGTGWLGEAQGDTLIGVENVTGSSVGDSLVGADDIANVLNGGGGNDFLAGLSGNDTLIGAIGNDRLDGGVGDDTLIGGAGADVLTGGAGIDTADYSSATAGITIRLWNGTGELGDAQGDTLTGVENVTGGAVGDSLIGSDAIGNVLAGGGGNDFLAGRSGNDTLIGGIGNDTLDGGTGDDLLVQGAAEGRDSVNGGDGTDTYQLTGTAAAETFRVLTRAEALALGITGLAAGTEIVVTRDGVTNAHVIAELDNVEEIRINALETTANNGNGMVDGGANGGDTIIVAGDFTATSLDYSTITIHGSTHADTIDITGLNSDHRIVFDSNGGVDTVIGAPRPQDVFNGVSSFGASDGLGALAGGIHQFGDLLRETQAEDHLLALLLEQRGPAIGIVQPMDVFDLSGGYIPHIEAGLGDSFADVSRRHIEAALLS